MNIAIKSMCSVLAFFSFFLLTGLNLFAQDQNYFPSVPSTPEVSAFVKSQEIPVNKQTGIPNISVPIATVAGKSLAAPISLSYHAGGIRVEEQASSVGLGWSLSAGLMINRTTRGLTDESDNGWLTIGFDPDTLDLENSNIELYRDISDGVIDAEPDMFSYSLLSGSGQFIFKKSGEAVLIPASGIRIEPHFTSGANKQIEGFTITDIDGTKYFFGKSKEGSRYAYSDIQNTSSACFSGAASSPNSSGPSRVGWYLLDVIDSKDDYLKYHYESRSINTCRLGSQTAYSPPVSSICNAKPTSTCYSLSETLDNQLVSISSVKDSVAIVRNTQRQDLLSDNMLNEFRIYANGRHVKTTRLSHSYFNTDVGTLNSNFCDTYISLAERNKRLRLDEIKEISEVTAEENPPYQFFYNDRTLPDIFSFGRDHWGYNNGKFHNSTLVPPLKLTESTLVPGGDRNVDFSFTVAGILEKVKYPSGIENEFTYESNVVNYAENIDPKLHSSFISVQANGKDDVLEAPFTVKNLDPDSLLTKLEVSILNLPCLLTADGTVNLNCEVVFDVIGVSDPTFLMNVNNVDNFLVPNGNYKIRATINGSITDQEYRDFIFRIHWQQPALLNGNVYYEVGGLRIAEVRTVDRSANIDKKTRYSYEGGLLTAFPIYEYKMLEWTPNGAGGVNSCFYVVRSSISNVELGVGGSHIIYANVSSVEEGLNSEYGKLISDYEVEKDHYVSGIPFAPVDSRGWKRNTPFRNKTLDDQNALLQKDSSVYLDYGVASVKGLKVLNNLSGGQNDWNWNVARYAMTSNIRLVDKSYSTTYDGSSELTIETDFEYDLANHYQITSQKQILPSGEEYTTEYIYANGLEPSAIKDSLISRNMIGIPIITVNKKGSNILSVSKVEYGLRSNLLVPVKVHELKYNPNPSNTLQDLLPQLQEIGAFEYDTDGNVIQATGIDGVTKSYLWSTFKNPIAQIVNANNDEVYYNSFEEAGTEGDAKSGFKYSLGDTYTIPLFERPVGSNLKLSFWYHEIGEWKYHEMDYPTNGVVTYPGADRLDEIRIHPKDAQMTTYTYELPFGVRTITDQNSNASHFRYDSFGRFESLKNQDLDLLQFINYEYRND